MGLYSIMIKPIVRKMDIERASKIALRYFEFVERIPGGRLISRWIHGNRPLGLQREVFGLSFYNPVGLGAGLDIHGELYNDLNNLGFSFVEAGPLDADGVRRAVRHIQNDPQDDILAACIKDEYQTAFTLAYDFFDLFVIDFSAGVDSDILEPLLNIRLGEETYKPIVVKLPKVISTAEIQEIVDFCLMNGIDGVEARDIEQVRQIASLSHGKIPIIANTHIETPAQAHEALEAGASLVEVRNGLVREGPGIVDRILKYLLNKAKNERNNPAPDSGPAESGRADA